MNFNGYIILAFLTVYFSIMIYYYQKEKKVTKELKEKGIALFYIPILIGAIGYAIVKIISSHNINF